MENLPVPSISFFGYILPFLIVLTIVVFFHELGHFLVARWNKVKVDAFSVGFGPELIGFNDRQGTRWKLCAIPLGGYVKFYGDANAASTPDFEQAREMSDRRAGRQFSAQAGWPARGRGRSRTDCQLHSRHRDILAQLHVSWSLCVRSHCIERD